MLSERRTRTLRELAEVTGKARTTPDAFRLLQQGVAQFDLDLPFTLFYLVSADGTRAELMAQTGLEAGTAVAPLTVELSQPASAPWPLAEVVQGAKAKTITEVDRLLAGLAVGPYPELPKTAIAYPLMVPGHAQPAGVMVCGASARLLMDESYGGFFDLLAATAAAALANALAYEEEKRKAEALAEIDRAKTAFFSNVSHEFRTPLTLMLGPLEDELNERLAPLPAERRERIEAAHRNSLRLLKLVNSLLDFSRLEAGRQQAHYQPTDLAALTTDLASSFRSAVERGGLTLSVSCPPLPEPVYVDAQMWEKIVLNLLSNAFKHTFEGTIEVRLAWRGDGAELTVQDSGVGIAAEELPKLFQRFHRVEGAASRTHEGTGIGLSLVQELVKLHGGSIRIESEAGRGSAFMVNVPAGKAHLPAEKISDSALQGRAGVNTAAYVQEALHWLDATEPAAVHASEDDRRALPVAEVGTRPSVLWADDNADMRQYVTRLLQGSYEVIAVADGEAALAAAQQRAPDLILSDVMMPRLDGFGLLKALRGDERTRHVPVILLSARAGEEAALEGLEAGADDYLIKPFSAKELLARVRSCLALAQLRRESAEKLEEVNRVLAQAAQAKGNFLANMSHEIRTPMNAIVGMTSILLDSPLSAEQRDSAEVIRASGEHLLTLINDILDYSKIETGHMQLEKLPISLRDCLESAIDLIARSAQQKAVEIGYLMDDSLPETVVGDAGRLRQVLVNLLSNAVKFTPAGGQVSIDARSSAAPDGAHAVEFSVRDTGIGIAPETLPLLFQSFVQADASTSRQYGGTGLGLAISRRLVELMGGVIAVESTLGAGSTFRFSILAPLVAASPRTASPAPPKLGSLSVLIVDDVEINRRILKHYTALWGMVPHTAESAQEALAWVRRGDAFDLALLDYHMPHMDGLALARELRALKSEQQLQIMMLSSDISGLETGGIVNAVVPKPIKPSRLLDELQHLFGNNGLPLGTASTAFVLPRDLGQRHPLRILIAEDNAVNQKVARLQFERMGYLPDIVGDGAEAVAAVDRQTYDVVFLDIQMPVMDGLEASREICRLWPADARPRLIAMTANASLGNRRDCEAAGMSDYITKPVRPERLVEALLGCQRRSEGADGLVQEISDFNPDGIKELRRSFEDAGALEIVDALVTDLARQRQQIDLGLKPGGEKTLLRVAHTLKGSSRLLQAQSLGDFCAGIEELLENGDSREVRRLLPEMLRRYEALILSARAALS